jgi:hypothetical protein
MQTRHLLGAIGLSIAATFALHALTTHDAPARAPATPPTTPPPTRTAPTATPWSSSIDVRDPAHPDQRASAPSTDDGAESPGPPQHADPSERAGELQARLADSGRGHEAWMDGARDALALHGDDALASAVELGTPDCFRAGCAVTATYAPGSFEQASAALVASDAFRTWPGWRFRSPPETDDTGRVVVTWYLMGPDAGSTQR